MKDPNSTVEWKEFTGFNTKEVALLSHPPELSLILIIGNQACRVCGNIMLKSYSNKEISANQPK